MEKRLKVWKRLLAVVLCFLLVAGLIPSSAIAAQEKNTASVTSNQMKAKTTTNEAIVTKPMTEQEGQVTSSQTDEGKDSVQAKSTEVVLQGETSQGETSKEQEVEATAVQGVTNETESAADTAIQADTKNEQATEVTAEEVTAETKETTDTKETATNQSEEATKSETTETAIKTNTEEATTAAGAKSTAVADKTEATETTDTTVETATAQSATKQASEQSDEEQTDTIQSATEQTDQIASSSLQNPRIVKDTSMTAGQKVTWDCVWFGSYPQSEVTSSDSVYSKLASATGWDSNNDIKLSDGTKYRRMKKGDATYATSGDSNYYDWEDSTTYHYFKYEPIKWRVLEVSGGTALLVADIALDDQEYNTNWTSVTWETSSMRSWLNGYGASSNQPQTDYTGKNFIDSAFTQKEQTAIQTTNVENKDNLFYGTEGGNNTNDKVFLLSESDVYSDSATSHGFVSDKHTYDEARRCKSSTYAKAMGTWSSTSTTYEGNCYWWLRSPGNDTRSAARVNYDGDGNSCRYVHDYIDGARPALNLNLSSSNLYTYAGTVCSESAKSSSDSNSISKTNRSQICLDKCRVTVYENSKGNDSIDNAYRLSKGATLSWNGVSVTTDKKGIATVESASDTVRIFKDNYVSREITATRLNKNPNVYLQKKSDKSPVISAVWINDMDALNESYAIDLTSKETTMLEAEVDWGSSSYGSIVIEQGAKSAKFTNDTLSTVLSNNFTLTDTIYIVATDAKGNKTKKELKLESKTVDNLESFQFDLGSKLSVKLPEGAGILAGTNISVGGLEGIVPTSFVVDNGKVYGAIGVDMLSASVKNDGKKTKKEVKNFVKTFKETGLMNASGFKDDATKATKKLTNLKKTYKDAIKKQKMSWAADVDVTVLGFMEGTIDSQGNIVWLDGGFILNPSGSASLYKPFVLQVGFVPVPLYFEGTFSVDALGQMNIVVNEKAKKFTPNGEISAEVGVSAGLGVGAKKVLYASGGLTGKLKPDWKVVLGNTDSFKLKATLNAYAKAGVGPFEAKKDWDPILEALLIDYPNNKDTVQSAAGIESLLNEQQIEFYDEDAYKLKDLSYLTKASTFTGNVDTIASQNSNTLQVQTFLSNAYKETTPKIASLSDGKKMAVWTDSKTSNANDVCLYYSYYNGSTWTEPSIVQEDGTMDYAPDVKAIGDTFYVTWQNATKAFDLDTTSKLSDIAKDFDISVAAFSEGVGFVTATIANEGLDMLPTLCGEAGNVYVAFVNNAENDWFGANSKNSILYSKFDGKTAQNATKAYDNLNAIGSLAADYRDGKVNVAYALDVDGDNDTADDSRIFENGTKVSDGDYTQSAPVYYDHILYWFGQNNILSKDSEVTEGTISSDRYEMLSVDGQKAIVYTKGDGLYSTAVISYFDETTKMWREGQTLTDGKAFIGAFGACQEKDGSLVLLVNRSEVTGDYGSEDPYGTSSLQLISNPSYTDLSIGEVYYDEDAFNPKNDMTFTFDVMNNGTMAVDGATIKMKDDDGSVVATTTLSERLVPGATREVEVMYTVPENVTKQDLTITVTPLGQTDSSDKDNTKSITLSYEKVYVENVTSGQMEDGTYNISADIVNRGYNAQSGITVTLRKGSASGDVIATETIGTIEPLEFETVSFDRNLENDEVYYIVSQKDDQIDSEFCVIGTVSGTDEGNTGDKDPDSGDTSHTTHTWDSGVVTKEATCTTDGVKTYTCTYAGCGKTKTETIKALGHDFKESSDKKATCTEKGEKIYKCTRCQQTKTEESAALGHDFKETSRTEATCLTDGSIIETCTRCGDTKTTAIPATKDISSCSVTLSKTSYTYSGKAKKPTVTLKDGSNVVSDDAYEVSYTNNTQVGTATVTVTGQNGYTGTVQATFTIKQAPGTYLIKYNANGGKNAPSTQTKKKNKSLKLSTAKPTRKGYKFQGWATSKSSTKVAYKSGATVSAKTNKNMTLYAVWKANTYKVAFNKNGGTGKMTTVTYTYGKSYTLKANAFKRTGYTFKGWNKKADGSDKTTYTNKAKVKNLSSTNGKTVTLYAQWKINKYKITYKLNGGTNNKSNLSSYKVTTKTITLKNPTRKGYKFKGWYTSSSFRSSTKVTKISKGSTGNKTLYAKWSKK